MKMYVLLLHIFVVLRLSQALYSEVNEEICAELESGHSTADEPHIICECRDHHTHFTLSLIEIKPSIRLTVKGCGEVMVPLHSLNYLYLKELEFIDIQHLFILPFAFASIGGIEKLKIADIANLQVQENSFLGLYGLEKVILSNVTTKMLPKGSFTSVTNIKYFLINDSSFDVVQHLAFALHNISAFHVINTKFLKVEQNSFLIHQSNAVVFDGCYFQETENSSFILSYVDAIYFEMCTFGKLASSSLQSNALEVFSISNSNIKELEPEVFEGLIVNGKIRFVNNTIGKAPENSLSAIVGPKAFQGLAVEYCCNSFDCDCSLHWMWQYAELEKNYSVIENSFCTGDGKINMSLYVPVLDSDNSCLNLKLKTSKSTQFLNDTYNISSVGSTACMPLKIAVFILNIFVIFLCGITH